VNDAVVRLGVMDGDFHWRLHDAEDEFFFVLEGALTIEVEGARPVRAEARAGRHHPEGDPALPARPRPDGRPDDREGLGGPDWGLGACPDIRSAKAGRL